MKENILTHDVCRGEAVKVVFTGFQMEDGKIVISIPCNQYAVAIESDVIMLISKNAYIGSGAKTLINDENYFQCRRCLIKIKKINGEMPVNRLCDPCAIEKSELGSNKEPTFEGKRMEVKIREDAKRWQEQNGFVWHGEMDIMIGKIYNCYYKSGEKTLIINGLIFHIDTVEFVR